MVGMRFDASQYEPSLGGGAPVKPEGWYTGMVVETKQASANENKENVYLEVKIAYQDGTFFINRYNIWNSSADASRIASQELSALVLACGLGPRLEDSQQLHNIPFEHFLSLETSEDKNKVKRTQNRLRAIKLRDGKIIGNAGQPAAPVTPAQTTPPQGGFGAPSLAPVQGGFGAPAGAPTQGQGQPQGGFAPAGGQPAAQQPWGGGQPGQGPAPAQGGWGGAPQQQQPAPQQQQPPAQSGWTQQQSQQGGFGQPGGQPGWGGPAPGT